jgi:hypothetical protein
MRNKKKKKKKKSCADLFFFKNKTLSKSITFYYTSQVHFFCNYLEVFSTIQIEKTPLLTGEFLNSE